MISEEQQKELREKIEDLVKAEYDRVIGIKLWGDFYLEINGVKEKRDILYDFIEKLGIRSFT